MASNLLSRLLPSSTGPPSVYETLRELDHSSDASDIEERAGMTLLDEENLGTHNIQLDSVLADAMESDFELSPTAAETSTAEGNRNTRSHKQKWKQRSPQIIEADEADDEVPLSLLIEGDRNGVPVSPLPPTTGRQNKSLEPIPVAGHATGATRAKWQATKEQQQLHRTPAVPPPLIGQRSQRSRAHPLMMIDPKEKAMWRWANVENLDNFLKDVYDYFLGNGVWCILLSRVLNLLTLAFVVGFGTFLTQCINYKKIPGSTKMEQILVPKCTKNMSGFSNFLIWIFAFLWIAKVFQYLLDIRRLKHMHDFYHYLLEIPDTDIQTISWQDVVQRLMLLRDSNPSTAAGVPDRHRRFIGSQSKQRMDAHDIANRLMRRDNFLIALFNKDILDLTLPIPYFKDRPLFSKTLEWNLSLCILDYVFNEQGQVRPLFLKDSHRRALSDGLRRRFLIAGVMNVVCAPFIIVYFMMLYFFRYFTEYQRNPSQITSRQYTPFAEWKFREFNELWHLFERRINMSYPFAARYLDQFPKDKTIQVGRFIAFIAGALASVLAVASVIDPDLFLGFEITKERTVLFYLGVFGSVWAISRGVVPEENLVFDPGFALKSVTDYTHYLPNHWHDRLHSDEVRREFAQLYQMKLVIFLEELLSIISTPFILWVSLPKCSDRLVDFFREFTVHVDGLGYVCSFAVFDFRKGGSNLTRQKSSRDTNGQDLREEYYSTKDNKMLASYYNFIDNYATNLKPKSPYLHQPRNPQFHLPPAFPGLTSPTLMGEGITGSTTRNTHWAQQQRRLGRQVAAGGGSTSQRTPHFVPTGFQHSPMASILLDPHHQPSAVNTKGLHKPGVQSRLKASRRPSSDLIETNVTGGTEHQDQTEEGGSMGEAYDSNLGESWKTTRAGAVDEDDDGEGGVHTGTSDKGPGVLGLVYQFSKAQTDGRGTGVNI